MRIRCRANRIIDARPGDLHLTPMDTYLIEQCAARLSNELHAMKSERDALREQVRMLTPVVRAARAHANTLQSDIDLARSVQCYDVWLAGQPLAVVERTGP